MARLMAKAGANMLMETSTRVITLTVTAMGMAKCFISTVTTTMVTGEGISTTEIAP